MPISRTHAERLGLACFAQARQCSARAVGEGLRGARRAVSPRSKPARVPSAPAASPGHTADDQAGPYSCASSTGPAARALSGIAFSRGG
jgi:hypothetical protein